MPGIENLAPERTLTSSGSAGSPSRRPICFSSLTTWVAISSSSSVGPPAGDVGAAGIGGDREPTGHRQPQHARHLGEVGALATEQVLELHRGAAMLVVEGVDVCHGAGVYDRVAGPVPRTVVRGEDPVRPEASNELRGPFNKNGDRTRLIE